MGTWKSIRRKVAGSLDIVILIHEWKGAWGSLFLEDMYGISNFIYRGELPVKQAKKIAKILKKYLLEIDKKAGVSASYFSQEEIVQVRIHIEQILEQERKEKLPPEKEYVLDEALESDFLMVEEDSSEDLLGDAALEILRNVQS